MRKWLVVAELHRLSRLAMQSVIDHLWPKGPKPDSYFGLVQQLFGARSRIDAVKRSACIEGAWMALARVKTYWADMEATSIAAQSLAGSQDLAEHHFEQVIEGARIIEAQCSRMSCSSDKSINCKQLCVHYRGCFFTFA